MDNGFTARHVGSVSGLDYYSALAVQFTNADLVLDGLNRYAYAGNDPEVYINPIGYDGFWSGVGNWIANMIHHLMFGPIGDVEMLTDSHASWQDKLGSLEDLYGFVRGSIVSGICHAMAASSGAVRARV